MPTATPLKGGGCADGHQGSIDAGSDAVFDAGTVLVNATKTTNWKKVMPVPMPVLMLMPLVVFGGITTGITIPKVIL